jgi:hypothetical protein
MLMWKKHLSQSKSPQKGTIYESAEEQIQVGNNMVIEVREEIEAQPSRSEAVEAQSKGR